MMASGAAMQALRPESAREDGGEDPVVGGAGDKLGEAARTTKGMTVEIGTRG